jgi:hypothetical protein
MSPDVPVYQLKPESGNGRTRVLHRNLLLPCDYLLSEKPPTQSGKQLVHQRTAPPDYQPCDDWVNQQSDESDSDSSEDGAPNWNGYFPPWMPTSELPLASTSIGAPNLI